MKISIPDNYLIACICEGGAETAIMNILLDNNMLVFDRSQMIEESVLSRTSVKEFEKRYLRLEYEQKILILRIIDSRRESFKLSKAYRCQVEVISVITAPEIEMLIIVNEKKYKDYCNSGIKKPSEYCKSKLKIKDVKSPSFVKEYFSDPRILSASIKEYDRIHKRLKKEATIIDLLK